MSRGEPFFLSVRYIAFKSSSVRNIRDLAPARSKTNPVPALLLGLPGPIYDKEAGIGDIIKESYQGRAIFESSEASRVMEQSFEFVVVNIVFELSQESSDEVTDEDHFGFECA